MPIIAESQAAIAVKLLGERDVDEDLVEHVVHDLNRIYATKGPETAPAIGDYVLRTFFAKKSENLLARGRDHVSFRQLANHDGLRVSNSFVYNAVAVVDQLRPLPKELAAALPFTHRKLLLPIKDEKMKVNLARKAVEKELTTQSLAIEVNKLKERARGNGAKVGRPNLPAFAKAFGKLKEIHELAASETISTDVVASYCPAKAKALLRHLECSIDELQATANRVREAMDGWEREVKVKRLRGV